MNKNFRWVATQSVIMASLLLIPSVPQASPPKKSPKISESKTTKPSDSDPAYEQWLKKYGAYDRMGQEDAVDGDDTSATPLKRAHNKMLQGAPLEALAVIEAQKAYEDPALETQRLWLGGQAHRALGDPYKAVIWYSQAGALMDAKQLKAKLTAEPGLDALWVDVWRRQFWAFVGNPSASRDALEVTLRTLLSQAETAWGPENFWVKSKEALAIATAEENTAVPTEKSQAKAPEKLSKDAPLVVTEANRQRIAQAVAAAGIEDYPRAKSFLAEVTEPALRNFWGALLTFLETGKTTDAKALGNDGYAKAAGFWNANPLAAYAENREEWFLGSSAPAWTKFKTKLTQLSKEEAQDSVNKELQSLLISDEMARLLNSLKFILTLEDGNVEAAQAIWSTLDKRKLPICMRMAGGLMFQDDLKALLPQEIGAARKLSPALSALLAAGGTGNPLPGEAPFWTKMEVGKSSNVNKAWPLDRLLVLADWQARWVASPGSELARRSSFLFPDTAYGYDCLLYLTQKAVENRSFQLAEAYLSRMEPLSVGKRQQAARLTLKAKVERDSGKDDQALSTYQELLALNTEFAPKTRLEMATFLQIKNDFESARKLLQSLWDQRDKLPKAMQAEVLFWLGEGEHSQRNYDAALDYYLRLAYQYPQEPMWPTAAMYRSAMIYELKGNFEPAKKLLTTVIATADTKEAKEAARNRLSALEAKTGKPTTKESGEPVYPF